MQDCCFKNVVNITNEIDPENLKDVYNLNFSKLMLQY